MSFENPIFYYIVIGFSVIVCSVLFAKFFFRVALFLASVLLIWYGLYFIGITPSPEQFFHGKFNLEKVEKDLGLTSS